MKLPMLTKTLPFCVCVLLACAGIGTHVADQAKAARPSPEDYKFFEEHVRPLLASRCYKCHGPEKQKGELRVDSLSGIMTGGESGPAIVNHSPSDSLLIEAVRYESFEMPPDGRLSGEEVATLERWIEMGSPWPGDDGKVRPKPVHEPKITDEDRAYWAFQPVVKNAPPQPRDDAWCRNDLDRFVLAKLEANGLSPAEEAQPLTLVRRLYFDLIGLPPTPAQIDAFLADNQPGAYERLVDRLLDSPQYGERWARHWLDLVRYAESDGYKQDAYRPDAWHYRDYVIRAFNNDKPYDQFIREQIAGDELAPNDLDALAATSYLRHWIYEYNQRDVRTQWDNILTDVTNVTSDVFLGLGMGCARCHDHKFDPILQEDYYRLKAFFTPLLPVEDIAYVDGEQWQQYQAKLAEWEAKTASIRRALAELERPYVEAAKKRAADKFPPDIRPMIHKEPSERLPLEQQLAELAWRQLREEVQKVDAGTKLKGEKKEQWDSLQKQLAEFDHLKPRPLPPAFTVRDVGATAPPTLIEGDRNSHDVAPGFLTVLDERPAKVVPPPSANSTGRRTALANWLASPENPLTTRVIVNRIWQQHFGTGIVATASDFGNLGQPPTHPELLDWLAATFVENGWRFKPLHRQIVTSATYRQNALRPMPAAARQADPQNRLLWRMSIRRLDAEQIRDAMLVASGELDAKAGGPSADINSTRRSIYCRVVRNARDPLLEVFDVADGFSSTDRRNVTTTPTQSLLMINGDWPLARAKSFATRLTREKLEPQDDLVEHAYRIVFGRRPTDVERQSAAAFIADSKSALLAKDGRDQQKTAAIVAEMPGTGSPAVVLDASSAQASLVVSNNPSLPSENFTIEAVVLLRSLYADATVRTIAAHWDSNTAHRGWALGVTSTKSRYQPRNLILQLVGDAGYEVVASDLRPELNKPYFAAASVALDGSEPSVTFYLKDLSVPNAEMQTAKVSCKTRAGYRSQDPFVIGGRAKSDQHHWHGLIDRVRLSGRALQQDELAFVKPAGDRADDNAVVGDWTFDASQNDGAVYADATAHANHGRPAGAAAIGPSDPRTTALIDFCHVLLNSNEFLYVD